MSAQKSRQVTRALVTAGATTDGIDDVRVIRFLTLVGSVDLHELTHLEISNIFNGRFGYNIACALAEQGIETTLVGSKDTFAHGPLPPLVRRCQFKSFEDLAGRIEEQVPAVKPELIFMSAAVADYTPRRITGKIASTKESLLVELFPNPKLIDRFRALSGENCTIVGFKVLSGLPDEVMDEYQRRQIDRAKSDFCVGNDLAQCDFVRNIRKLRIRAANGEIWRMTGGAEELAHRLAGLILQTKS